MPNSPAEALVPQRPPELPPQDDEDENDHPFLRMFDGLLNLIFFLLVAAVAMFYVLLVEFDRPGPLQVSTVFAVPKGASSRSIVNRLTDEGIISDRRIFLASIFYFMHLKGEGSLKAGEYQFDKHATMREVLNTLVDGKTVQFKVTFPEGWTSQQIVTRLEANAELDGTVTEVPPEGSLLPDTYRFGTKDSKDDVLQRMTAAQEKFLAKVWEERDPDIMVKTPEEAVILASIVEKETGIAEERPRIASVFNNRLRKGMRLQSDPTIIYGIFGGSGMRDHPITKDELKQQTPYNTYQIDGLPPTPIGNPGRAAIEAVLKPAKTDDLYFVADGTGGHIFSSTLAEHNKNVAEWRKIEREIRARQKAEEEAAQEAAERGKLLPEGEVGLTPAGGPVEWPLRNPGR
ncbi:endolytic transglycosylase MltG [Methyloceanibacter sp.]|uniref:endolytic transglycosylase MltG n=1 Tax=Methyloceanibacter sp. TaxID=1965321 RepID=UPI002C68964B|nr:endolytic transglycosylase MltG [Methyloceanibacter sp.]HML92159.1 endolytic transglycosylase MltG [Methyloceanibacter sp.]